MEVQKINISRLHLNTGQIKDVPKNPRFIKDERYQALKKSIADDPEMLDLREIVAYDNDGELVIVMGNMRYRAMKELGFKEAPVKVLPKETKAAKLRAYILKDNIGFGQNDWDMLANEWDAEELKDFGLECDFLADNNADIDELFEDINNEKEKPQITILKICIPDALQYDVEDIKRQVSEVIEQYTGVELK